jgi:heterogeneous nuclear ribonucleoprotein U-like protein 1
MHKYFFLSYIDTADLNLTINTDCLSASNKSNDALCFLWAGVRATYGFQKGKICYEIRVNIYFSVYLVLLYF